MSNARLTVVDTVYYQSPDMPATSAESRFSRELDNTDQQPYVRRTKVTEEWAALDCGWLNECSMLLLVNEEGRGLQKIPTPEEKKEIAFKVLEIRFGSELVEWLIPPGESLRGYPVNPNQMFVRCRSGEAKLTIHLFPR